MATLKHAGIVRTTLGTHGGYAMAAQPSSVSIGRIIRLLDGALAPLPCVSLRYYEPCSCPDEATCSLRDVMIDVRDAILEILDRETLADLAARPGPPLDRSARPPCRRARGTETLIGAGARFEPTQSRSRLRSAALTRSSSVPPIVASARAIRDASRASASE